MTTKIHTSLQNLSPYAFTKQKLLILPDVSQSLATTSFLLDGNVKNIQDGINEEISCAEITFPKQKFGTHVNFMTPIVIMLENANNTLFRGFIGDEDAIINNSEDYISIKCYDYRWYIAKFSKMRGKLYTTDNTVHPDGTFFTDASRFEKFRHYNADALWGFKGDAKTIFNENNKPDCAAPNTDGIYPSVFKFDPDKDRAGFKETNDNNVRYSWNYATILNYIYNRGIRDVFYVDGAGDLSVYLNRTSLSNILRFGEYYGNELIIPKNFDIDGLNPAQAIDKVVKAIPGNWYWRLLLYREYVMIDIQSLDNDLFTNPGYTVYLGNEQKIATASNNKVNIKELKANRSIKDAVSHAVATGGAVQLETTIEYIPGWDRYLRNIAELTYSAEQLAGIEKDDSNFTLYEGGAIPSGKYLSNFKNQKDYEEWFSFVSNTMLADGDESAKTKNLNETLFTQDQLRYSKMFRVFEIPKRQQDLTKFPDKELSTIIDNQYAGYISFVSQLILKNVLIPREVLPPLTDYLQEKTAIEQNIIKRDYITKDSSILKDKTSPIFVFLYDKMLNQLAEQELSNNIVGGSSTLQSILNARSWLMPDSGSEKDDTENLNYSFDKDNKIITFEYPQFCRKTISFDKMAKSQFPSYFNRIFERNIFVTCRIKTDVPLIMDQLRNSDVTKQWYGNLRMVSEKVVRQHDAVIRVNAVFPVPQKNPLDDTTVVYGHTLSYSRENGDLIGQISVDDIDNNMSKLVEWNRLEHGVNNDLPILVIDDREQLNQLTSLLLGQAPLYYEFFDITLAKIDMTYKSGNKISKIENSELVDGSGGYNGLNALIEHTEISSVKDDEAYTMSIRVRNNIPPNLSNLEERE